MADQTLRLVETINRAARELAGERVEHGPIEGVHECGMPILRALGVDTRHVTGFTLECNAGELPHVSIRRVVPKGFGEAAATVLEKFSLCLKSTAPSANVDQSVSLESQYETTHRLATENDDPEPGRINWAREGDDVVIRISATVQERVLVAIELPAAPLLHGVFVVRAGEVTGANLLAQVHPRSEARWSADRLSAGPCQSKGAGG